jgi:hypothetical protein
MKSYVLNRPVNALKKLYAPSYLGAKIRAAVATPALARITEISIQKRLNSSEGWAYKTFPVFKGVGEEGVEYRDYLAPSPITSAAEAFILHKLGAEISGLRSPRVFSYVISQPNANHNYVHYLSGYERRNLEILGELSEGGDVALFLDVKGFYNSVDKERLIELLKADPVFGRGENEFAFNFVLQQLSCSPSGIPIGTELSHVLADIYLRSLDELLSKEHGTKYFRYVDDLTIVCKVEDVDRNERRIERLLADVGLSLNGKKREVLSRAQWADAMNTSPIEGQDFYDYCFKVGEWMAGNREKTNWLDTELRNQGFQMPLNKILTWKGGAAESETHLLTEKQIIDGLINVRREYSSALEKIAEGLANNPNRWYLQKTKRAINPLFYLLNKESYDSIIEASKESAALKSQEEVSRAMKGDDCRRLVQYPGVAVSSFCEIWKANHSPASRIKTFPEKLTSNVEVESATTLALFEVMEPHSDVMNSTLWKALRPDVPSRGNGLPAFEAEIESIRIGISSERQQELLGSRLSPDEDLRLSALDLGSQTISP